MDEAGPFYFYASLDVMMNKSYISKSTKDTRKLARLLGEELRVYSGKRKSSFVIALSGELGSGKTFFATHLARGLGTKSKIQSPTFVIAKRYTITRSVFKNLWHIDLYRIKKQSELKSLSFKDIIAEPNNIVVIEWAERVSKLLPKDTLWITFFHSSPTARNITFSS
ncbi:MAG: tRNA (adenosine(37)-N6)-threonylcarbamoyltransferase complex ATPase subunit type 1 TsaE [bacterium]|nr:tRNA (adenosine(37)-N6)-threonylcarbamoyltransferase complex ATPase subunit type 1 TsaE [bacterium]